MMQFPTFLHLNHHDFTKNWLLHENDTFNSCSHPEAAASLSFESLRGFLKRCRKRVFPPRPANLEEFVERATNPVNARNLEYGSGRLSVQLVTDEQNYSHVVVYDAQFVRDEMSRVDRLFIDGTFSTAPAIPGVYQLVTIIGIKFGHVIMKIKLTVSVCQSYKL